MSRMPSLTTCPNLSRYYLLELHYLFCVILPFLRPFRCVPSSRCVSSPSSIVGLNLPCVPYDSIHFLQVIYCSRVMLRISYFVPYCALCSNKQGFCSRSFFYCLFEFPSIFSVVGWIFCLPFRTSRPFGVDVNYVTSSSSSEFSANLRWYTYGLEYRFDYWTIGLCGAVDGTPGQSFQLRYLLVP